MRCHRVEKVQSGYHPNWRKFVSTAVKEDEIFCCRLAQVIEISGHFVLVFTRTEGRKRKRQLTGLLYHHLLGGFLNIQTAKVRSEDHPNRRMFISTAGGEDNTFCCRLAQTVEISGYFAFRFTRTKETKPK